MSQEIPQSQQSDHTICKYCQSEAVVKFGTYKGVQRYFCKFCKRKFSANTNPFRMRIPSNQISSALSMYYEGMSVNAISRNYQQEHGYTPSSATVYEWVEKYTPITVSAFRDYHPKVGNTWIADETVLNIDGQDVWFWDIIDRDTRFLLASHVSITRSTRDAQALMVKAQKVAGKSPKVIITDKLSSYLDGIELTFGGDTEHKQSKPFTTKDDSTNDIERFHGTLKARTKVMRGLKSVDTAIEFTDGWLVHYNYFRNHESLGNRTPAEVAGVNYGVKNWADVVRTLTPETMAEVSEIAQFRNKPPKIRLPLHKIGRPHKRVRASRRMSPVSPQLGRIR
jgi:putative transposase